MADVDFSHAVLDVYAGNPMNSGSYLNFASSQSSGTFVDINGNVVNPNDSYYSIITNTPTKVSILFTGTFTASGTEFYTYFSTKWKVSNISFSSGDTYSFIIDIETEGNT